MKSPVRKAASSFPSRTAFPTWTCMIPSWPCTRAAWPITVLRRRCCITSAFPRWKRFIRSFRTVKAPPGAVRGASTGIPIIPAWNRKGRRRFFPENCRTLMPSAATWRRRRLPRNPERKRGTPCGAIPGKLRLRKGTGIPRRPRRKPFRRFRDSSRSSSACWDGAGASFSATVPSWFFNW